MRKLSWKQVMAAEFDPSSVATSSASIGDIKINPSLNVQKIKDALKRLMKDDFASFAKARDFDYIISDAKARQFGETVPGGKAVAWFSSGNPDVCFIKRDYVNKADVDDIARTIVHEATHGRKPGYGEWSAEEAERHVLK